MPRVVDKTWRRVATMRPAPARRITQQAAERQPVLLQFLMAAIADERPAVQQIAIGKYLRRNDKMLERIERLEGSPFDRFAEAGVLHEPAVLSYIVDALAETVGDSELLLTERGIDASVIQRLDDPVIRGLEGFTVGIRDSMRD